jgi:glycosyltransferase involved in cell wall biosynthesis
MSHSEGGRGTLPGYLFLLPWYPESAIGGVNQALLHLIDFMNEAGEYKPYLLICNGPEDLPQAPHVHCPMISLPVRNPASERHPLRAPFGFLLTLPWFFWKLRPFLKQHNIRAINYIFPDAGALSFVLMRKLGIFSGKVIVTLQGNDLKLVMDETGFARFVGRLAFRLADCVVACSGGMREDLLGLEPGCVRNSVVIHNSIDIDGFLAIAPPDFQLPERLRNRRYLLNIGRYEHKKGQDILIRAFDQIAGRYPDLLLVMMGSPGPEIEGIRAMVAKSPFTDRILMLENVPHEWVPGMLQSALAFVLPSRREGLPFAVLEAAACRKAVAAAACVGVPELIKDRVTGRLVAMEDADALAVAISDLVESSEFRQKMGENLYRLVRENFTWQKAYRKYASLSEGLPKTAPDWPF